jgi:26S proteasome regulatory subunit N2
MGAMVEVVVPSSAAPALALLDEIEPALQAHALTSLNSLADSFWPEISGAVDKIQELSESTSFPEKGLASLVAAKVLFHLGELDESLRYALAAGVLFDVDGDNEFANTLRSRCIDEYIAVRTKAYAAQGKAGSSEDPPPVALAFAKELERVVERVLLGCIEKGEIHEAIGVAIEAHRLDKLEEAILKGCHSDADRSAALDFCFECALSLVASRQYRTAVLNLISTIHLQHFTPETRNHLAVANCLNFTQDAPGVVSILMDLVTDEKAGGKANEEDLELTALQIAFDIVDNDEPHFASRVCALLPEVPAGAAAAAAPVAPGGADAVPGAGPDAAADGGAADDGDAMETDALLPAASVAPAPEAAVVERTGEQVKIGKLRNILSGKVTAALSLDFLCSQNRSDGYVLKKIKQSLDGRSSVCHSALIFCNAIAHGGTAIDTFLRENLDWLARATAWAKFSATSCLGVIHARHTASALILLSPYLPSAAGPGGPTSPSAYSEGGALYALGLIAATGGRDETLPNRDGGATDSKAYLLEALRAASNNEVVQHGACLGLGLAAMASWDGVGENEVFDELKNVLAAESAVAGEAAGLAVGLLSLGSGSDAVAEQMLEYAHDTQHEKITRGVGMGLALLSYGREDDADRLIDKLVKDKDPLLRYGGMYAVALAYCGTADNKAIRLLLHSAVSDLSDDVRRAAVIAIGFVLFRHAKQVPKIVALLSESCHAHVRYGAAMAIGIACTGTGLPAAVEILERLTTDPSDFVRQGALIGLSLLFMHHTEERSAKAAEMRKLFESTWSAKLEDAVTRFGAVLASGLIDAGGRNGSISLTSATGHRRMSAIVGMAMFTQFWYWFPLVHFIGLSIKPSALIGLNRDLKMPKFEVVSDAAAALYDYVPSGPPEKVREVAKAPTAVLSVTAKTKAREQRRAAAKRKEDGQGAGTMEVDADTAPVAPPGAASKMEVEASAGEGTDADGERSAEVAPAPKVEAKERARHSVLSNPCRVLAGQEKHIRWSYEQRGAKVLSRYVPIKSGPSASTGIVLLRDQRPGEAEEFVEMASLANHPAGSAAASAAAAPGPNAAEETGAGGMAGEEGDDGVVVEPPAPFQYTDEN